MKNLSLSAFLGGALVAASGLSAIAAPMPASREKAPLSRMRKASPQQRWSASSSEGERLKRISPHFTTPASDTFEYLYAPDGSLWYAVCTYDTEYIQHDYYTETVLKGFTFTFFDSKFNEVGKIRDRIELQDGETRCVQVMLGSQLTKKFFNNSDDAEVMVAMAFNTPEYVTNTRTFAYSIKDLANEETSTPLTVMQGYPVDAVDCSKDKWSEEYYITMLTEERPSDDKEYPEYIDYLADYKQVLTTYGNGLKTVMEHKIPQLNLPGDQMSSPMMLCKKENGKLTLAYAQYEKSFFVDPTGMGGNEDITPDNHLVVDIYQMNDSYPAELELINTTKIETLQNTDNQDVYCTYYGIGNLMWDKDVDFGNYTSDGRPAFVVSTDDYLFSDDDHYNSGYFVYDADGNRIGTIAENTYDYVMMSDLPGFEPQAMFIHMGDDMNFEMVDLYSCQTVTEVDHNYRGYTLSVSTDRVSSGDSYVYGSALSYGMDLGDNVLGAPVCWFDTDGEFVRLDVIPTGEGVELAQIYMIADGLSPFVFNTDTDLEYMLLVKRNVPGHDSLREELLIASPQKGVLHTFTEKEGLGFLRSVYLMAGEHPELLVVYMDESDKFTAEAYSLPFDTSMKGSGTESDPFLIASGGDLQQIRNTPGAFYRLSADIDCSGLDFYPIEEFTGTLDGDGHTVSNLRLVTCNNGKTGLFISALNATVKDIVFDSPKMILTGGYESGLIAATASGSAFDNIHVLGLTAIGDGFGGEFGGIAGKSWLKTAFNGCWIAGADFSLPSSPCMGGIVGDIRTGTTITACAVAGDLNAYSSLGGIVGSTTTGDETVSQCHVDANLKAQNTVGGIVGFLDRSKVRSNYVAGTIEATVPSKWNNAVAIGGIAGELEGDWQGNADVPIACNLIGISSMNYPDMSAITEQHPRQLATIHRVVGRSSFNTYLEEEPNKIIAENGVYNNFVVSGLEVVDGDTMYSNIEGSTISKDEVTADWLKNTLEFAFGNTVEAPWSSDSKEAFDPYLWYEDDTLMGVEGISAANRTMTFVNGILTAEGRTITVFDINGAPILSGSERLDCNALPSGVYVALAADSQGHTASLKFAK